MDRDALLDTLRAAFATDLADQARVLEEGLVALEQAAPGEARDALLREVFRAAHGLKGSARAAGLSAIEATCHAMESLLGAARDEGRPLVHEDYAALLAGVDALADAQRRLAEAPRGEVDEAPFARARAALEERVGGAPPPAPPPAPRPRADGEGSQRPRRPGGLRLAPERLDALVAAGGALLTSAQQAEARAERVDELARDARRVRGRLRATRPILARAAQGAGVRRGAGEARAAQAALSAEDDLHRLERGLSALRAQLALEARALARRTHRLSAEVRGLRLTPWGDATAGLERAARDAAAEGGKEVEVRIEGEGLELDRSVVDALRDPLAQLVRNAVGHGIEPPDERRAAGKPPRGTVEVSARIEGERVYVRVSDDGRGVDLARLREEARRRGIEAPADPRRSLDLLFLPGFSTAPEVTALEGRGVGLDVVASAVRAMRGVVGVSSRPGRGTAFEVAVPTTLYGLRALLVRDAGQVFALPALDVQRVVRLAPDRLRTSGGRPVLLADGAVPLSPLAHVLGLAAGAWSPEERRMAVVVAAGDERAAFAVEEVLAERELSLEPLGGRLEGLRLASAVAALPGGDLAVVLAARELVELAHGGSVHALAAPRPAARPAARRVLLADDAATTRALTRSILEASGYEVLAAADGEQAWALLQQQGADVVLSDVEMPRMSGFDLTRAIRQSPRFARLPVVLLTALEDDADRKRGLDAGADAYLVKSAFDQRVLVETLSELLEGEVP